MPCKIKKKFIKRLHDGMKVYLVSGEAVRRQQTSFIGGGTHSTYPNLIPSGEIWIESGMKKGVDRNAIILHEDTEYRAMRYGHFGYGKAHRIANEAEAFYRKMKDKGSGKY